MFCFSDQLVVWNLLVIVELFIIYDSSNIFLSSLLDMKGSMCYVSFMKVLSQHSVLVNGNRTLSDMFLSLFPAILCILCFCSVFNLSGTCVFHQSWFV